MAMATCRKQSRLALLVADYDRIRDLIEQTIPGFDNYNSAFAIPVFACRCRRRSASGRRHR
jgi:hypothetical protein